MDAEQVLVECYMLMADVDYDLRRWEEELEQARYASHLDRSIDEIFETDVTYITARISTALRYLVVDKEGDVPLVIYDDDGKKHKIGSGTVDLEQGTFTAYVSDTYAASLVAAPKGSYSIGYDEREHDLLVKPVSEFPKFAMKDGEIIRAERIYEVCSSCEGTNGHHYVGCTLYR